MNEPEIETETEAEPKMTDEQIRQTITNAFAYAHGESDDGDVKDVITDNETKPEKLASIYNTGIKDEYGDLDEQLAEMDANPVGAEPGGPDDTHGLSHRGLMNLEIEGDMLDSSNLKDRKIIELTKQLAEADQRYEQLQANVGQLRNVHDGTAKRMTEAEAEAQTLQRENRKLRKDIAAYKGHINQAAQFLRKNAPKTRSAKQIAFLKLADLLEYVGASEEDRKKKIEKTRTTKKRAYSLPKKKAKK